MAKDKQGKDADTISVNRQAYHAYNILEKVEAGIALTGTEVKSLRQGRISLKEAYVRPEGGELWLVDTYIPRYQPGGPFNHEPNRPRKLLLHRQEIAWLTGKVSRKGLTIVPLRLYFKGGWVKVELGLAQGKTLYDKRQVLRERDAEREAARALKTSSWRKNQ